MSKTQRQRDLWAHLGLMAIAQATEQTADAGPAPDPAATNADHAAADFHDRWPARHGDEPHADSVDLAHHMLTFLQAFGDQGAALPGATLLTCALEDAFWHAGCRVQSGHPVTLWGLTVVEPGAQGQAGTTAAPADPAGLSAEVESAYAALVAVLEAAARHALAAKRYGQAASVLELAQTAAADWTAARAVLVPCRVRVEAKAGDYQTPFKPQSMGAEEQFAGITDLYRQRIEEARARRQESQDRRAAKAGGA